MYTVKKIWPMILLVAGLAACSEDDGPQPGTGTGITTPAVEGITVAGVLAEEQRSSLEDSEVDFRIELRGGGGSNLWDEVEIVISHDERYWGESGVFSVADGVFEVRHTDGEGIISGTYTGSGTVGDDHQRNIIMDWQIQHIFSHENIADNRLNASLEQRPDGSYYLLLVARGQPLPIDLQ